MSWFGLEIDAYVRALEFRPSFPPAKPLSSIFHDVFGVQALSDQNPSFSVRRSSAHFIIGAGFFDNDLPVQVARGKLEGPTVFFGLADAEHRRTEGSGRNARDVEVHRYLGDRVQMVREQRREDIDDRRLSASVEGVEIIAQLLGHLEGKYQRRGGLVVFHEAEASH